MAKTNKKALGLGLAGVMSVGAIAGAASALNVADAAESQAQKDAKAKIQHSIYSINTNYARIENQVTWEGYIREARALIAKMPAAESTEAAALTKQVDGIADTVIAIARINHVEKSMRPVSEGGYGNYLGIKNVPQWQAYLEEAKKAMANIDKSVFQAKYDELLQRHNDVSAKVKAIEDEHYVALGKVQDLFDAAKKSGSLADAEKALEEAKKLGTHESSAKIVKEIEDYIAQLNEVTTATAVSIVNTKNLKVDGTGLAKIKADDIKVDGNKVKSVQLASDGKSLNVELEDDLLPNYETSVKITIDGNVKEFKVTNGVDVKNIQVVDQTFGHDRVGQKIGIKINGQDMTVDYLKAAGYDVKFVATKAKGGIANIFTGGVNTSATGEIYSGIKTDDESPATADVGLVGGTHKVEVQIIKNGSIVVSAEGNIKIDNLNQNAKAINTVVLANVKPNGITGTFVADTAYAEDDSAAIPSATAGNVAYKMNSNTMVSGEEAAITSVMADVNGENIHISEANVSVTSSNTTVVSVASSATATAVSNDYVLKANVPGTATITVKVGTAEKKINITVTNQKRTLSNIALDKSVVTLPSNSLPNQSTPLKIKTLDQFGDPIAVNSGTTPATDGWLGTAPSKTGIRMDIGEVGTSGTIVGVGANATTPITVFTPYIPAQGTTAASMGAYDNSVKTNSPGSIGEQTLHLFRNTAVNADKSAKIMFYNHYQNPNTSTTPKNILATATVNVTTTNTADPTKTKLRVVGVNSSSAGLAATSTYKDYAKDFKLDLTKNKYVRLEVAEFNANGLELGTGTLDKYPATGGAYTVEVLNTDIADVVTNPAFVAGTGTIDLVAKAKGTTDVVIRKPGTAYTVKATITVDDSKVEITKVTFNPEIQPVIGYENQVKLGDIISVTDSGSTGALRDPIVGGIELSNGSTANVRISKATATTPANTAIVVNDLYLDINGDGKYNSNDGDRIVGSLVVEASKDSASNGEVSDYINAPGAGGFSPSNVLFDYVFKSPAKTSTDLPLQGTVMVYAYSEGQDVTATQPVGVVDKTKSVGSTSFRVDVKLP